MNSTPKKKAAARVNISPSFNLKLFFFQETSTTLNIIKPTPNPCLILKLSPKNSIAAIIDQRALVEKRTVNCDFKGKTYFTSGEKHEIVTDLDFEHFQEYLKIYLK